MKSLNPKYIAHVDFTLEYLLQGLKNVNIKLEDILQNQILTVFGRSGPAIEAMFGDYDTSLVPDTPNLRYQTDTQKLYNDATSSIQTQLDSKVSAGDFKTIEGQSIIGVGNIDLNKADVGLSNVDNTSDANKPISIATQTALDLKEDKSNKGIANGYAPLDNNVKIPLSYINDALIGNVHWKGLYNGTIITSSPDPTLVGQPLPAPSSSNTGWYFISVSDYTYSGTDYKVGDWIISNGVTWDKVDNTDAVSSVFGRVGNVTAQNGDYIASQITNVPSGNISSVTVQAALNELDSEKAIDTNVVHKAGFETITGQKEFSATAFFTSTYSAQFNGFVSFLNVNTLIANTYASGSIGTLGSKLAISGGSNGGRAVLSTSLIGPTAMTFDFPNQSGTFALTSDLTPYALDANVVHKTGNEGGLTGIKSWENTTSTQTSGLDLTNSGTTFSSRVLQISNISTGVGAVISNISTGFGLFLNNTGAGFGNYINNLGNGTGLQIVNDSSGKGLVINSTGANIGTPFTIQNNTTAVLVVDELGNTTGKSFIKSGATTTNILLAGGADIPQTTFVPSSRTININGVSQDLSTNRSYRAGLSNTGALTYAGSSVASSTTINIGAVTGVITDNETTPSTPTYQTISYAGATNITVPTIASGTGTYVLLNSAGALVFQNTFPTSAQRKSMIYLSKISHPNSSSISFIIDEPDFVNSPLQQFRDLFQVIQYMNQGITISGNAGLTINSTNGVILGDGINFVLDKTNPNMLTVAAGAPRNFLLLNQSGAVGSFVTTIDPANYDVGGVTTPIGGSVNSTTIQYLYYAPGVGFAILRGQTVYPTLLDAVSAVGRESFVLRPNLVNNSILIAAICLRRTTTAMNDPAFVRILLADKFGQIGGASSGISVTNLQTAYNNSLIPQITTTSALGAFTLRNGGATNTDNVFAIQNIAGTTTASINGNGAFTGTSWNGYTPANDANVVHKTGDETITGTKLLDSTALNPSRIRTITRSDSPFASLFTHTESSTHPGLLAGVQGVGAKGIQVNITPVGGDTAGVFIKSNTVSSGVSVATMLLMDNDVAGNDITPIRIRKQGTEVYKIDYLGNTTGTSFIKSGATATNILLAGGTDIPQSTFAPASGSGNYIQNQNASAQSANMWINGNGRFGSDLGFAKDGGSQIVSTNAALSIYEPITYVGSQHIFINGNVGIGTTNPLSKLHSYRDLQSDTISIANSAGYFAGGDVGIAFGQYANFPFGAWMQSTRFNDVAFPLTINPNGGNVGIGISNPLAKNHIVGGGSATDITTAIANASLRVDVANPVRSLLVGYTNNSSLDGLFIQAANNATNNSYTLPINPFGGNVLIGTTGDNGVDKLQVSGSGYFSSTLKVGSFEIMPSATNGTNIIGVTGSSNDLVLHNGLGQGFFENPTGTQNAVFKGNVKIEGLIGTGTRTVVADASGNLSAPVSDESLKENIQPIHYGLNEIMKMNPVSYNFKDKEKYGDGLYLGNIAQDMEKIIPEAVFTNANTGKMGIEYSHMHAVYIKAIQELQEIINKLLLRIERLENK